MDSDVLAMLVDWVRAHYFGKYRGTVIDNHDESARARLKVRVPAVLGDLEVWAMPCVPYAGDKVGAYFLPEPDTGVWVEFEGGDPSYPIWTGCFWQDDQLPDAATGASQKVLRTAATTLVIDDDTPQLQAAIDDGGALTIGDTVELKRDQATHTVASDGITSAIGGQKTALTQSSFSVDDGALEVM